MGHCVEWLWLFLGLGLLLVVGGWVMRWCGEFAGSLCCLRHRNQLVTASSHREIVWSVVTGADRDDGVEVFD